MRSAYLQIIRICNQNCIFCAQPQNWNIMNIKSILKQFIFYKKNKINKVIITWWEPTIHSNLKEIINIWQKFWFKLIIQTNWLLLSEDIIISKLSKYKEVDYIISIHSHKSEIHDFLKNYEWSFKNTVKWIKKLYKTNNSKIKFSIAVNKYNIWEFKETIKFLLREFPYVEWFIINNLDVYNIPEYNYDIVAQLSKFDNNFREWLKLIVNSNKKLNIERVPMCYLEWFEQYADSMEYILWWDIKYVHFLQKDRESQFLDKIKRTPDSAFWKNCNICSLRKFCWWIPMLWILYNTQELVPIVKTDKYIDEILKNFYLINDEIDEF